MKTVGILGAGQLGLLLSQSIARLGGRCLVFDPDTKAPAHAHCLKSFPYPFQDREKLLEFFKESDVITYEFEHLPIEPLEEIQSKLRPSLKVLETTGNRLLEKRFLKENGFPLADFLEIESDGNAEEKLRGFGLPAMVKTVSGGYDGKGQFRLSQESELSAFLAIVKSGLKPITFVAERLLPISLEVSCIVARQGKKNVTMPIFENVHERSILDTTVFPSDIDDKTAAAVERIAVEIAEALDLCGILTVEFFLVEKDGGKAYDIYVNELAPRPHNSGHLSMNAMNVSQFDLLARILLDLPFEAPRAISGDYFAMSNLLGDLWFDDEGKILSLDFAQLVSSEHFVDLVLYGKTEPRANRKMGHIVVRGRTLEEAMNNSMELRAMLNPKAFCQR